MFFQFLDTVFRRLHVLAGGDHFVARTQGLGLGELGVVHDVFKYPVQLGDALGLADLVRVAADLLVIAACARGDGAEPVDEGDHHVFHADLGFRQAVLEQALLVNDFLQAACGVEQSRVAERAGDQFLHAGDLPAEPGVVVEQFTDVFEQQPEQAQQQLVFLCHVRCLQFEAKAELLETAADVVQSGFGVCLPRRCRDFLGFAGQIGCIVQ